MTQSRRRGGTGSNQYQTRPGQPAATRAAAADTAAAADELDDIAFAFSPAVCPPFDIPDGRGWYPHLAEPGQNVWEGEEPPSVEMFSGQGDLAVTALIDAVTTGIDRGWVAPTSEQVTAACREGMDRIYNAGHHEVFDTEPRNHVIDQVQEHLRGRGYDVAVRL